MTRRTDIVREPYIIDVPDPDFEPGQRVTCQGASMTFASRRRNTRNGQEWLDMVESQGEVGLRRSARLGTVVAA